jgi:hypothetical protein
MSVTNSERGIDMATFRIFAVFVGAAVALASCSIPLAAQPSPASNQSGSTSVRVELPKDRFTVGEKPIRAVMTIRNIGQHEVCFLTDRSLYRIHVTRKDIEPSKTQLHRHLRGEFRPGDGLELMPGPVDCRPIAPGSLDSLKYDLMEYYDLSAPGDYSVYIEIYDQSGPKDGSGLWLRTNTAHFKIEAHAQ